MARKPDKQSPVWRETPLDHWNRDIDPAVMAGDEWVTQHSDPGSQRIAQDAGGTLIGEQFMHPQHDTTYDLDEDVFTSEGES